MKSDRFMLSAIVAPWLIAACSDPQPATLRGTYEYEARFQTTQPPDTVVGRIHFTDTVGDSVFGTFEDLDPDPDDAAQFGTEFPVSGVVRGIALEFRISAPGVRINHEGSQSNGTITGTCSAEVFEQPEPFPCTFVMWEP